MSKENVFIKKILTFDRKEFIKLVNAKNDNKLDFFDIVEYEKTRIEDMTIIIVVIDSAIYYYNYDSIITYLEFDRYEKYNYNFIDVKDEYSYITGFELSEDMKLKVLELNCDYISIYSGEYFKVVINDGNKIYCDLLEAYNIHLLKNM